MRENNHRRSSDKIWAQVGKIFRLKNVIFLPLSLVMMIFYFINQTNFVGLSTSPKNKEILMSEVAKALKLTLFTVRSLKALTPAFSQIFSVTPNFFQDFDNRH